MSLMSGKTAAFKYLFFAILFSAMVLIIPSQTFAGTVTNQRTLATYSSIEAALANSDTVAGDVLLCDGLFTGPGNYNIRWSKNNITLKASPGSVCTIDAEGISGQRCITVEGSINLTIEGITLQNGRITTNGGGIALSGGAKLNLINVTIKRCTAEVGGNGGAIYSPIANMARIYAKNCTFIGNKANYGGVGYYGTWTVADCTFSGNKANSAGVGFYGTWEATDCIFEGNNGGGVGPNPLGSGGVSNHGTWYASRCKFNGNIGGYAGGVGCESTFTATNCAFSNNTAGYGGVADGGTWYPTNCTFYNNSSPNGVGNARGGVAYEGRWTVKNCIFWGNNYAGSTTSSYSVFYNMSIYLKVSYSDIQPYSGWPAAAGTGNISKDAQFTSITYGDTKFLHLFSTSPCIDTATFEGAPTLDADGKPRPQPDDGVSFDMGAYEFQGIVVTVISPEGGELIKGGNKFSIIWTAIDDSPPADPTLAIKIYYASSDAWVWIADTSQSSSGVATYEWMTPSTWSSTECRIRVYASNEAGISRYGTSKKFTIDSTPPLVTIEAPSAKDITLEAGPTGKYMISWEATDNIGLPLNKYISIYLSIDGGSSWPITITTEAKNNVSASKGLYLWTVPDGIDSNNCLISVEATDKAGNIGYDISNNPFTIVPSGEPLVTVEAPNAPDITLESTTTYNISWDAVDRGGYPDSNYISIYYYSPTQPTPGWKLITTRKNDTGKSSGTYTWTVPNVTSVQNNCLVSVEATDKAGNTGRDVSDYAFTIIPSGEPLVTVEAPNATGITLEEGEKYIVSWRATDLAGFPPDDYITINLSINGGATWETLCATEENDPGTGSGTYEWIVPGGIDSNNCLISVEATNMFSKTGRDVSNFRFTIVPSEPPEVTVEFPSDPITIVLEEGGKYIISWEAMDRGGFPPGGDYITIYFSTNEGLSWATLTTTEENDPGKTSGIYNWTVPNVTSEYCRISVEATDKVGNIGDDISDSNFKIVPALPPVPTLEAPSDAGISIDARSIYIISWEATDNVGFPPNDYIKLFLSTDGGSTWTLITSLEENVPGFDIGLYEWVVPDVSSETCRISVEAVDKAGFSGYDISDIDFAIRMKIIPGEPTIEAVYINNIRFLSGDIITAGIHMQIHLLSHNGIATASVEIDGIQMESLSPEAISSPEEIWSGNFVIPGNLRHINTHMFRFIVRDQSHVEAVIIMTAIIMTGQVDVIGKPLNYPNPFSPMSGRSTLIQYTLSVDAPIMVVLFDITGHQVKRLNFSSGANGGRAGVNNVSWDGRSLTGNIAGNGMYIFEIISENRLIGTGKMVIMD